MPFASRRRRLKPAWRAVGHEGVGVGDVEGDGVEEGVGAEGGAAGAGGGGEQPSLQVYAAGDAGEAGGAVPDGVHAGHDGEQDLGGADVAGGLFAADVLFAGLQREAEGGAAGGVLADADEAAGHLALEGVAGGEEAGVGSAEAHGHAEALGGADDDVGAHPTGGGEEDEGEEIGADDGEGAGVVGGGDLGVEVAQGAGGAGVLQDDGKGVSAPMAAVSPGAMSIRRMPRGAARVARTARVWGWRSVQTATTSDLARLAAWAIVTASAAAVASSSRLALAMGMPVRSQIMVGS